MKPVTEGQAGLAEADRLTLEIEKDRSGVWFVTSPDLRGLLVAKMSRHEALADVDRALNELALAAAPSPDSRGETGELVARGKQIADACEDRFGGIQFDFEDGTRTTLAQHLKAVATALSTPPQKPGMVTVGYVTKAAFEAMRSAKPGWHYHLFATDQTDPKAEIALIAIEVTP